MDITKVTTTDGVALEVRWDIPDVEPDRYVVFCHPHPLHGGTMTAPLMEKITSHLVAAGSAVLRFNFRGIGRSGGSWGGGREELQDVDAVMGAARDVATDVALIGWSFGAAAALRWQSVAADSSRYVGIAPPVVDSSGNELPGPHELEAGQRRILIGERDQLIPVEDVRAYAASIAARFDVVAAADHFFHYREERVAALVLDALEA